MSRSARDRRLVEEATRALGLGTKTSVAVQYRVVPSATDDVTEALVEWLKAVQLDYRCRADNPHGLARRKIRSGRILP